MEEQSNTTPAELDITFCCDCTGSMGSYIEQAQRNIRKISEQLHAMEKISLRYGLVCYRDHPPQDSTYATKVYPLTDSLREMQQNVGEMSASGGGDGPESVACALHEALQMDYRKNAARVVIIIADAPPHGIGERGDGFPNGCPCGHDPLQVARKMADNKIVVYSVAVEPAISGYINAKAFFHSIAEITSGRYVTLGNAHLLADVVVGGSAEEIDLKKFEEEIVKETLAVKAAAPGFSSAEVECAVERNLQGRGVCTYQLNVTHQQVDPEVTSRSKAFIASPCLAEASSRLPAAPPQQQRAPSMVARGHVVSRSSSLPPTSSSLSPTSPSLAPISSYQSQQATYGRSPISLQQVQAVIHRNNMM